MAPFVREALINWKEKHPGEPTDKIVDVPAGFVRTFNEDVLDAGLAKMAKVDSKMVESVPHQKPQHCNEKKCGEARATAVVRLPSGWSRAVFGP